MTALSNTLNERAAGAALPQAITVPAPSLLHSAFSFIDKDSYLFGNLIAQLAEKLQDKGVSVSSLTTEKDKDLRAARFGLFDGQGRETVLTLSTFKGMGGLFDDVPLRSMKIRGDRSGPGTPLPYAFEGGMETFQPPHWGEHPETKHTFWAAAHGKETHGKLMTYKNAFDDVRAHPALAAHLADKMLRGFVHDVDPETYEENIRQETPSLDVRARRYHFPKEMPVWNV